MEIDFLKYYDLEQFLFDDVRMRFHKNGFISAFDLFSIIVWKANRAKTYIARRMLKRFEDLDRAAREFSGELHRAASLQDRFFVATRSWGFRLPMASAILAVLWPDDFTVYDVRVCNELGRFHSLAEQQGEKLWPAYVGYCSAVRDAVPGDLSLRNKDRQLWGRSAAWQLQRDIECHFRRE